MRSNTRRKRVVRQEAPASARVQHFCKLEPRPAAAHALGRETIHRSVRGRGRTFFPVEDVAQLDLVALGLGLAELEDQFARLRRRHVLERHRQLERLGAAARARRYHGLDPGVIFILNPDLRTHIHGPAVPEGAEETPPGSRASTIRGTQGE